MATFHQGVLAMMGHQSDYQQKLFITGFNLDKRIPQDHILRRISEKIDFNFIYNEVKETYGEKGNVSVPPPVILKLMLLLILYKVRSERELMARLPLSLDWLWFLGYDLEDELPNHSVLSKARTRWGVDAFKDFFERIVLQCMKEGLVDGHKLFIDASLIDADASRNSVIDNHSLKKYLNKSYLRLEKSLDELNDQKTTPANERFISTTDPDASVTRHGNDKSKLRYKTHRIVDEKNEIITATKVTAGSVDDGNVLMDMIDQHEHNTGKDANTVVADTKYGSIDNYLSCHDRGLDAHIPSIEESHRSAGWRQEIFSKNAFIYNPDTDTFTCPAGEMLKKKTFNKNRRYFEYRASSKSCRECHMRKECTHSKSFRTLKRHERQNELDTMTAKAKSRESKKDLKTRQHLSERSFARSTRYGFKRSRWRRLWRMEIQDFLVAAIQNITVLISRTKNRISKSNAGEYLEVGIQSLKRLSFCVHGWATLFSINFLLPSFCKS
jgi:transposase